ncbi:MAG: hypothetical protein LKJ14_05330, partial [Lactobacillus amylovorus]|nr:hypothetical protein [Lactobacillus amylovorus]
TSIGNSQKTIAGKSSPYLSKLVFWLAQANEPLSPRLQSRVVDSLLLLVPTSLSTLFSLSLLISYLKERTSLTAVFVSSL